MRYTPSFVLYNGIMYCDYVHGSVSWMEFVGIWREFCYLYKCVSRCCKRLELEERWPACALPMRRRI
jgi:hypothetical protein